MSGRTTSISLAQTLHHVRSSVATISGYSLTASMLSFHTTSTLISFLSPDNSTVFDALSTASK